MNGTDTLKTARQLSVDGKTYHYFSLPEAAQQIGDISRLPFSLKVLLENVLRFENGRSYTVDDAKANWTKLTLPSAFGRHYLGVVRSFIQTTV